MPNLSLATRRIPAEPSTGTASNPFAMNASVSLQDPLPRSRMRAPGERCFVNLSLAGDMSDPNVLSKYPSGSES